jgi:hypothetical protein
MMIKSNHLLYVSSLQNDIHFCSAFLCYLKSRDSSVGTALGYGLDDRGSRVRFPTGAGNFSLHHRVQNGSGAHPASYPVVTRGSFAWVKLLNLNLTNHLHIVSRSKNAWSYTFTPPYVFMAWCLVKHSDNVTFTCCLMFIRSKYDIVIRNNLSVGSRGN